MFRISERPHMAIIFRSYFDETYTEIIKQACQRPTYTIKMWPNWRSRYRPQCDTEWCFDTDNITDVVCWLKTLFDTFVECQKTRDPRIRGNTKNYFKIMYKEIK